MSDQQPVISIHGLTLDPRPPAWQPKGAAADKFHVERAPLTERLGLTRLGINVTRVAPGKTAYPFHSHRCNDELFFIVSGQGELRLGEARHAVKPGDVIGCPIGGPETAHQIINDSGAELAYISVSTMMPAEVCEYPDSGKIGAFGGSGESRLRHMTEASGGVD